ncbi:MAG: nucleoside-diphosphate sugar epimerase/dehydratase [Bacteroidales bacterium]|nr:nucleoside-diphosphate sugar epimerase/dehydratase [Bacteroidales bacterium]
MSNWIDRLSTIKYLNRWIVLVLDTVLVVFSTIISYSFTLYFFHKGFTFNDLIGLFCCSLSMGLLSFLAFRTYRGIIRYSTIHEMWRILSAMFLRVVTQIFFISVFLMPFPYALLGGVLDFLLSTVLLVAFRAVVINVYRRVVIQSKGKHVRSVFIYGHEGKCISLGNSLLNGDLPYRAIGYLTHDKNLDGTNIGGLPVKYIRYNKLQDIFKKYSATAVLFCDYADVHFEEKGLVAFCLKNHVLMFMLPPFELVDDNISVARHIKEVQIEDLLGRDEILINTDEIGNLLRDKIVLVTGAAGSIGSEIVRQLSRYPIKRVILFDSAETPMHNLVLELRKKYTRLDFEAFIGDVRSKERVNYLFSHLGPQIVFHAAAYKHVPLMEENPCEAVLCNVYGTRQVANAADRYGIEKFVMISTDKAVNPTNVMGSSKRIAEIYVQSLNKVSKTQFVTTRFGNVLGSNGSVIPLFREQIRNGGPVTVTHPDIIRYFMTIPEACRLVLEAGTIGKGGEIYVFDMGEPVKILDLAKRMIELAGLEPDKDIHIQFSGLRPGEKLYEELLTEKEHTLPTNHPKINVAMVREYQFEEVSKDISELVALARAVKIPETVLKMKAIVPEYISQNSPFEKLDKCVR